jgi:hypothetical protein
VFAFFLRRKTGDAAVAGRLDVHPTTTIVFVVTTVFDFFVSRARAF